jgi:hypothetical protein
MAMGYKGDMETVLDRYSMMGPGLTLYYPNRTTLPRLRAFADFARTGMRRDFGAAGYLPMVASWPEVDHSQIS